MNHNSEISFNAENSLIAYKPLFNIHVMLNEIESKCIVCPVFLQYGIL